ncbi:hypothetical protein [Pseudomonas fluorescens]|uniref:hypothetical protein n=1 Tax=Pseudomonas fluorescens TaxID=294 RepID=UPI00130EC4E5|nr:hypothetical protein [Pseudomonas fluorescens]
MKRLSTPAFWRIGIVVGVALVALIGVQSSNWVKRSDAAAVNARADIKAQFSTEAWALEMWDRCRSNQGEFADSRTIQLPDCDKAVLQAAGDRGSSVKKAVIEALAAQDNAVHVSRKDVNMDWPLSIFQAPIARLAMWLFANR